MRPGARRNLVASLRKLSDYIKRDAEDIEHAELPDIRRVGVGWGSVGCTITVGGAYHLDAKRDRRHIVDIIHALAWALFESQRDSGDPEDAKTIAEVRGILRSIGERLPYGAARATCERCGDTSHICIACDGECKVKWDSQADRGHPRETKLCPDCSAWLEPRELG